MFFTSYEFLGFITVLFILYYVIPGKYQWMLLLLASYFFYFVAVCVIEMFGYIYTFFRFFAFDKAFCAR